MAQQPQGKRESSKQERRERLYQAAVSLFREQGYEETTVDQITRRAGLAKGTFFNYFATKDAVLRYMGERAIGRLGNLSVAGGSTSAVGSLKRFLAALADSLEQDRDLVRLIFNKGIAVPELLCGNAGGFSIRPMAALMIRRAQHQGEINPLLDPDALAMALDALYLQQLVLWCEAEAPYPLAERFTGVVDLLMMGIAAR
ncbi:MAG: TetR/AcrR family transcriptional regulator [Anaerolineae bacterium]|nr:TetR/AcrR family transcriptional regulator [Anaerolineae bacterium]